MSTMEIIYAIAVGLGLVAGFMLEWRRGNLASRLQAVEAAASPSNTDLHARVYELEQWRNRVQRAV